MSKKSFESYLIKCKEEAKQFTVADLPATYACPFCPKGKSELKQEKKHHVAGNNVYEGIFFVYKCTSCGEGFTTTISDAISLATFKPKQK
jgi:hypothetical protein